MRNAKLLGLLPVMALLVLPLTWVRSLVAQQDRKAVTPTVQQERLLATANQQQTTTTVQLPDAKTFRGKILRSGDQFVLQDGVGESTYLLDDQAKAKFFEGRNVKVTGTVDEVTKTIAVADLKPEL
jgi:hypothetical protein